MQIQTSSTTASQEILSAAKELTEVIDSKGRKLAFRPLTFLEESRVVRLVGAEDSKNVVYMTGFVLPAVMVRKIDDQDVFMPTKLRELEHSIQTVGSEGAQAVINAVGASGTAEQSTQDSEIKN